jgi:hypothetical protein
MNISNRLTALAADINSALTREETNRDEWVTIKLDLCRTFAEARAQFSSNNDFGDWLLKNVGNTVSEKDRQAYINMGADLEQAETVLRGTRSSSIQLIHKNEFKNRPANASGTAKKGRAPTNTVATPDVREQIAADVLDHGLTYDEVLKSNPGISVQIVKTAVAAEQGRRAGKEEGALEEAPISASAQKKIDAHQRKLEKDFEFRVRAEVFKRSEEYRARFDKKWADKLGAFEKVLNRRGKVFTKAEYNAILRVLHPDTGGSVSAEARAEAFRLFNDRKVRLLDEKDFPVSANLHDLVAMREAGRAAVKAARAAKKAERANP